MLLLYFIALTPNADYSIIISVLRLLYSSWQELLVRSIQYLLKGCHVSSVLSPPYKRTT